MLMGHLGKGEKNVLKVVTLGHWFKSAPIVLRNSLQSFNTLRCICLISYSSALVRELIPIWDPFSKALFEISNVSLEESSISTETQTALTKHEKTVALTVEGFAPILTPLCSPPRFPERSSLQPHIVSAICWVTCDLRKGNTMRCGFIFYN